MLILISIGFLSKRAGLLKKEHAAILNDIIIYLTMPALIFRAVAESHVSLSLLKIPLLGYIVMTACLILALVFGRFMKLSKPTFGALLIAASLGNTGYLGYPITLQLFGIQNLVKAIFYDLFGTVVFMFTIGLFVAGKYGKGADKIKIIKEVVTFPPLLGLFAALLLKGLDLPGFLSSSINFLANATIPLIMFSIGLSLELTDIGKHKAVIGLAGAIKLVLSPLLAFLGASIIGMGSIELGITTLEASMPTAMITAIIGLKYGLDTDFLPAAIVATTLISLITIPVWQYVLRLVM
ncbi:MAG: AEC family transporter [Actinomycetota bacterium]|nr:AEC family transporter [Actinomycetota bacterium]